MSQLTSSASRTATLTGPGARVMDVPADPARDRVAAGGGHGGSLIIAAFMLFASALPDAMVVPLLNELLVQRYGVGAAAAHWFMSVNLIGAVVALPLLWFLRRRWLPATMLLVFAAVNAALLLVMWSPIGFAATIWLRVLEGAADLLVFAVLFDLFAKAGVGAGRGRRLGFAGMILMFGLFAGVLVGGGIGDRQPIDVFVIGAMACLVVALAAVVAGNRLNRLIQSCPAVSDDGAVIMTRRSLWPALVMISSDRAVAGLMTATLPLFFAGVAGLEPSTRGWLIGLPLMMMALGAWPAGWLSDRAGHLRVRVVAASVYAGAIATLPVVASAPVAASLTVMAVVGMAGAALFPTSLAVAAGSGRGSIAMGAHRSAGDVGYLAGVAGAGAMLATIGGEAPDLSTYALVIGAFAGVHLAMTIVSTAAIMMHRRRPLTTDAIT